VINELEFGRKWHPSSRGTAPVYVCGAAEKTTITASAVTVDV
jgi:hypothetical protein